MKAKEKVENFLMSDHSIFPCFSSALRRRRGG
jgi:hypothetical protein